MRNRDNTIFFCDEILDRQVVCRVGDFRQSLIAKVFHQLFKLCTYHCTQSIGIAQNIEQVRNFGHLIGVFLKQLLMLQTGQAIQSKFKNGLCLSR